MRIKITIVTSLHRDCFRTLSSSIDAVKKHRVLTGFLDFSNGNPETWFVVRSSIYLNYTTKVCDYEQCELIEKHRNSRIALLT